MLFLCTWGCRPLENCLFSTLCSSVPVRLEILLVMLWVLVIGFGHPFGSPTKHSISLLQLFPLFHPKPFCDSSKRYQETDDLSATHWDLFLWHCMEESVALQLNNNNNNRMVFFSYQLSFPVRQSNRAGRKEC